MAYKAEDEEFISQWNQASAWAQTNDIPTSTLAPVYQYDLNRLQNGDYPMSQAERIRAIQVAANPNDVTPVPSDKPSPSNVFGNARRDLGMIFTGLEPNHLVANLWDTTTNTLKDIGDPKRLEGKNTGTTVANLLQNTLLSFVPGAYDIGTVLRADPTLSSAAGFKALADDPVIALMDVMPSDFGGALTRAFAKTDMGAAMASHLGMDPQAFAGSSLHKLMGQLPTSMFGVKPAGGQVGTLTVGDWISTRLQNSAIGTSKPVQTLAKMFELNAQHFSAIKQTVLQPFVDAYGALDSQQLDQVADIISQNQVGGKNLQDLLEKVTDPAVRNAIKAFMDGPVRFAREQAVAAGDVTAVRRLDGSMGLYTATQDGEVLRARQGLQGTHKALLEEMGRDEPLLKQADQIRGVIPKIGQAIDQANQAARQVTESRADLLDNATDPDYRPPGAKKPEVRNFGRKRDMARKMFGQDGMVDQLVKAVKAGDHDQASAMAAAIDGNLKRWGAYSVKADEDPAFQGVAKAVRLLRQAEKRQDSLTDELNRRIVGNARKVERETAAMKEQREYDLMQQKAFQENDRRTHWAARRQELDLIRTSHQLKIDHYQRLFEQMQEAALAKGDVDARRANKAGADAIYARVKNEIAGHALTLKESIRQADKDRDAATTAAKARWDQTKAALSDMHRQERKQLLDEHAAQREIDGELTRKARAYLKTLRDFNRAVYDHPTDNWRDMRYQVYAQNLIDGLHNAELLEHTSDWVKRSGKAESEVTKILQDPQRLREAVVQTLEDMFTNPKNFDPELISRMEMAKKAAQRSALDEVNRLRVEGYTPEWIPAVNPKDRPSMGVKANLGTDHIDAAFRRSNQFVNTRYDIEAAGSKAVTQALRRDASIQLLDDLRPQVMTGTQLKDIMNGMGVLEGFDPKAEHLEHAYAVELEKMGLVEFNPVEKFRVNLPAWENERLFLPAGLKKGLDKMMDMQAKTSLGLYDKGTDLLRFSILRLSPRYTAHIDAGGMMMLALRSTPYLPAMLVKAYRAMKDGTIPQDVFTHPSEEGFTRLARAVQEHSRAAGKQGAHLALQEHIATVQKVALDSKLSPAHWLKAAADLNMRHTRFMNNLYRATAFLDYTAKAERSKTFIDEVTGEEIPMTRERAEAEGQKHAIAVFGDLRLMSPFERAFAMKVFPFWGWTRHILSYVASYPNDHPWRAMMLSLMGYENSANVPKGLPERIQFLMFLGSPNASGAVTGIDTRFMDPFRDTANYASLSGWLEGLNPALLAPISMVDPSIVYGSNQLYPNLSYDQFYGISTAGTQGTPLTGLEQFVPQLGALATGGSAMIDAMKKAGQWRKLAGTNPNSFYKSIFEDLNIPFAQIQKLNVKQIAVSDEIARYDVAKGAATTAFQTGDFSGLKGYSSVPSPLNPDYEVSPAQLEAVYNAAVQAYPGLPPDESVTPPPSPPGI